MTDAIETGEAKLIADYADLGISCGYVGGVHMAPLRDDRSWRVFTKLSRKPGARSPDVCVYVFDLPPGFKGVWKHPVYFDTEATRAVLDDFRAMLADGRLHRIEGSAQ